MKKIGSLFLTLLLAITIVFCLIACDPNTDEEGGKEEPQETKVSYEISVDTSKVLIDASEVSVCIYSLDGTLIGEKKLSKGKTLFELDADSYVATLGGVSEEISYSSVLLTESTKKATIALEDAEYNENSEAYEFAFTVIAMAGDTELDALDVQVCDDLLCRSVSFDEGNVAYLYLSAGEYEVKVYNLLDSDADTLYHEDCTVTTDKRFCVIVL